MIAKATGGGRCEASTFWVGGMGALGRFVKTKKKCLAPGCSSWEQPGTMAKTFHMS